MICRSFYAGTAPAPNEAGHSAIEASIPGIIMAVLQYTSNSGAYLVRDFSQFQSLDGSTWLSAKFKRDSFALQRITAN